MVYGQFKVRRYWQYHLEVSDTLAMLVRWDQNVGHYLGLCITRAALAVYPAKFPVPSALERPHVVRLAGAVEIRCWIWLSLAQEGSNECFSE